MHKRWAGADSKAGVRRERRYLCCWKEIEPDLVVHVYNPSSQEAETGGCVFQVSLGNRVRLCQIKMFKKWKKIHLWLPKSKHVPSSLYKLFLPHITLAGIITWLMCLTISNRRGPGPSSAFLTPLCLLLLNLGYSMQFCCVLCLTFLGVLLGGFFVPIVYYIAWNRSLTPQVIVVYSEILGMRDLYQWGSQ